MAGALPQTPQGELTAFPRPSSWISGAYLILRAGSGRKERGEGKEEGRGRENSPLYVLQPWREIDAYEWNCHKVLTNDKVERAMQRKKHLPLERKKINKKIYVIVRKDDTE